jgi:anaerobic magnesium-protoporphyrin IX monomethyl ester cyclase
MATIVFIQRLWYEYPGTELLAAVLKKGGHSVRVIIAEQPSAVIRKMHPGEIAAFSIMTGMHHWAIDIAVALKQSLGTMTVFGGAHPTYFPELVEKHGVDIICRGEGEHALLDLANAVDAGGDITGIPNLWVKKGGTVHKNPLRPLIDDLDTVPFQDRTVYYESYPSLMNNPHKIFLAGRGCPFECTFCFNDQLKNMYKGLGKYVRFRSPANIIAEIKDVMGRYPLGTVFFNDDIFVFNHAWLSQFLPLYKSEVSLPFFASARADTLREDTVRLLKEAGCKGVSFAIESGNEELRNKVLGKRISNKQIEDAAAMLKRHGIKFATYNIIGIPGETVENALETVEINIRIKTDYPRCSFLTPYPGTKIADYAKRMGYIESTVDSILPSSQQGGTVLALKDENAIRNIHAFFTTAVLFPSLFPAIKVLIKWPYNILFRLWWMIVYFINFSRSEGRSLSEMFLFAVRSFRSFAERRRPKK